jgi:hypothetical protein
LIDSFKIDSCLEAKICVLFDKRTAVSVSSTDGAVVESLRAWIATNWETERKLGVNVHDEIFLLVTEPKVIVIIVNGRSTVAWVRGSICVENFAHHEVAIDSLWIWKNGYRLEEAVRRATFGLSGRRPVEHPFRAIF